KARTQIAATGSVSDARATLERMLDTGDQDFVDAWIRQDTLERNYRAALARVSSMPFEVLANQVLWQPRALLSADLEVLLGECERALARYDEARQLLEREIVRRPDDARLHSALGRSYAGLGRKADAIREAVRGVELLPTSKDALVGPARIFDLAHVDVVVGDFDAAFNEVDRMLSLATPLFLFSVHTFQVDPTWDALRQQPRYQGLIERWRRK